MPSVRLSIIWPRATAFQRIPGIRIASALSSNRAVRKFEKFPGHFRTERKRLVLTVFFLFVYNSVDEPEREEPCAKSPCGPNSQCRAINGVAVCSCLPTHVGSPPACRPECVSSSECPSDKACVAQKCVDPCPASCGLNADCRVINHSPLCSCQRDFTGDPFTRCFSMPSEFPGPARSDRKFGFSPKSHTSFLSQLRNRM